MCYILAKFVKYIIRTFLSWKSGYLTKKVFSQPWSLGSQEMKKEKHDMFCWTPCSLEGTNTPRLIYVLSSSSYISLSVYVNYMYGEEKKYQPDGTTPGQSLTADNAAPPAKLKQPLGGPKMADRVWKGAWTTWTPTDWNTNCSCQKIGENSSPSTSLPVDPLKGNRLQRQCSCQNTQ